MDIELLVVRDCPHEALALDVLRMAGVHLGDAAVTVIESEEQAREREFRGSPTFLIGGVDQFAVAASEPGLSCRMYQTATGLAGVPSVESVRSALRITG